MPNALHNIRCMLLFLGKVGICCCGWLVDLVVDGFGKPKKFFTKSTMQSSINFHKVKYAHKKSSVFEQLRSIYSHAPNKLTSPYKISFYTVSTSPINTTSLIKE